jgi:hypothetical protein
MQMVVAHRKGRTVSNPVSRFHENGPILFFGYEIEGGILLFNLFQPLLDGEVDESERKLSCELKEKRGDQVANWTTHTPLSITSRCYRMCCAGALGRILVYISARWERPCLHQQRHRAVCDRGNIIERVLLDGVQHGFFVGVATPAAQSAPAPAPFSGMGRLVFLVPRRTCLLDSPNPRKSSA